MNKRIFSIALLASSLPWMAMAESQGISLNKGDFISAEKINRNGEAIIGVKLSKSGKAKVRKMKETVHAEIAGVETDFKVREPIHGDAMEMGPYTEKDADKVVNAINKK